MESLAQRKEQVVRAVKFLNPISEIRIKAQVRTLERIYNEAHVAYPDPSNAMKPKFPFTCPCCKLLFSSPSVSLSSLLFAYLNETNEKRNEFTCRMWVRTTRQSQQQSLISTLIKRNMFLSVGGLCQFFSSNPWSTTFAACICYCPSQRRCFNVLSWITLERVLLVIRERLLSTPFSKNFGCRDVG